MFQRVTGFFRKLFSSKGFRRGLGIFLLVLIAWYIYNLVLFFFTLKNSSFSFGEVLSFILFAPLWDGVFNPFAVITLHIVLLLAWYIHLRKKSREAAEPAEKAEKAEEPSGETRDEEFMETTRYRYH